MEWELICSKCIKGRLCTFLRKYGRIGSICNKFDEKDQLVIRFVENGSKDLSHTDFVQHGALQSLAIQPDIWKR
jgi:hypothetical protein